MTKTDLSPADLRNQFAQQLGLSQPVTPAQSPMFMEQDPPTQEQTTPTDKLATGFKTANLVHLGTKPAQQADPFAKLKQEQLDLHAELGKLAVEAKAARISMTRATVKGNTVRYLIEALQELNDPDILVENIEAVSAQISAEGRRKLHLIFRV